MDPFGSGMGGGNGQFNGMSGGNGQFNGMGGGNGQFGSGMARSGMMNQKVNTGFGPLVYGPGVNNQFALPANPFRVQQMTNIARTMGGLVRINQLGGMEITDRFGQRMEWFGEDLEIE